MKVFVDNVAAQAVEACLLAHLIEVLSPTSILKMPADLVTAIAGEPEDCQVEREHLTRKLAVLKAGLDICKRYASRPLRGTIPKITAHDSEAGKKDSSEITPHPGLDGAADSKSSPPHSAKPSVPADNSSWPCDTARAEEPFADKLGIFDEGYVGAPCARIRGGKNKKR